MKFQFVRFKTVDIVPLAATLVLTRSRAAWLAFGAVAVVFVMAMVAVAAAERPDVALALSEYASGGRAVARLRLNRSSTNRTLY